MPLLKKPVLLGLVLTHILFLDVFLLLLFVLPCKATVPAYPRILQEKLKYEGVRLPYYIFLRLWIANTQSEEKFACSILVPSDSAFGIFKIPVDKELYVEALYNTSYIAVMKALHRGTSPDPFTLVNDPQGAMGDTVLDAATFDNPAVAQNFVESKLFVWKSLGDGKLLGNGAEIIHREPLPNNCVLLVAKSFPFARSHFFVEDIIPALYYGINLKEPPKTTTTTASTPSNTNENQYDTNE